MSAYVGMCVWVCVESNLRVLITRHVTLIRQIKQCVGPQQQRMHKTVIKTKEDYFFYTAKNYVLKAESFIKEFSLPLAKLIDFIFFVTNFNHLSLKSVFKV